MTPETPKPGNDTGLPDELFAKARAMAEAGHGDPEIMRALQLGIDDYHRLVAAGVLRGVTIMRRGGVNYVDFAKPPKRRAKAAGKLTPPDATQKAGTDADALRAMFPYLVIPRPGIHEVRINGRMMGRIKAQPGTDAFGKEYAAILVMIRQRMLRDLSKGGGHAAHAMGPAGIHLPIALLCELSNDLMEEMGAFIDDVNNGPATRALSTDDAWNPDRMAKLREMQAQYSALQKRIMTHPEAHTVKTSTGRTVGAKRRAAR